MAIIVGIIAVLLISKLIGGIAKIVGTIALVGMLVVIPVVYFGSDNTVAQYKEQYEALMDKIESDEYKDELGALTKEVLDEIQEWNETIKHNKDMQNNFWVGVFWPDIYDQFETIDYEKSEKE